MVIIYCVVVVRGTTVSYGMVCDVDGGCLCDNVDMHKNWFCQ